MPNVEQVQQHFVSGSGRKAITVEVYLSTQLYAYMTEILRLFTKISNVNASTRFLV